MKPGTVPGFFISNSSSRATAGNSPYLSGVLRRQREYDHE